jgi:hypothetical protein
MGQKRWRRQLWPAALLVAGAVLAGSPGLRAAPIDSDQTDSAQMPGTTSDQPDAKAAAMSQVANSCVQDATRFCPELGDDPAPRDMMMCLRAYQVDLSLSCRTAIRTAASATSATQ